MIRSIQPHSVCIGVIGVVEGVVESVVEGVVEVVVEGAVEVVVEGCVVVVVGVGLVDIVVVDVEQLVCSFVHVCNVLQICEAIPRKFCVVYTWLSC
jgi:hypothetical protein